jgi:hypothetical protein
VQYYNRRLQYYNRSRQYYDRRHRHHHPDDDHAYDDTSIVGVQMDVHLLSWSGTDTVRLPPLLFSTTTIDENYQQ